MSVTASSFAAELAAIHAAMMPTSENVSPKDFTRQALKSLGGDQAVIKALGNCNFLHDYAAHSLRIKLAIPRNGVDIIRVYLKNGLVAFELIQVTHKEVEGWGTKQFFKTLCRAGGLDFVELKPALERHLGVTIPNR